MDVDDHDGSVKRGRPANQPFANRENTAFDSACIHHDLDFMVGTWVEDSAFEDFDHIAQLTRV